MKKLLILLSIVLLVVTGCASTYVTSSEQEIKDALEVGINLVDNPGFETGGADNWGTSDSVYISMNKVHSGMYSALFAPVGGSEYFYNVITADSDWGDNLIVSCWVNLASAFDADNVVFMMERQLEGRNETFKMQPEARSGWQQLIMEVPAADIGVQNIVVKAEVYSAQGPVYFDDFQVVSASGAPVNFIRNGSFSSYEASWSGYAHSYGRDGDGALLDFSVPNSGLAQSTGWNAQTRPVYDSGLDMEFSVYVAPTSGSEGIIRLRVERKPSGDSIYRDFMIREGSGWQMISMPVPATAEAVEETIFHIETVNGTGTVMVDDVSLEVTNLQNATGYGSSEVQVLSAEDTVQVYLTNANLESGDSGVSSNWGLSPGWDQLAESRWMNDGVARSGSGSVYVMQERDKEQVFLQADGWQDRSTTAMYDPSQPMLFSAWVNMDSVDGDGVYLRVERKYDVDGAEQVLLSSSERVTGSTDGWQQLSVYVAPSDIEFKEVLWDVVVSPGTGSLYIDDLDFVHTELQDEAGAPASDIPEQGENVLRNAGLEELNPDGSVLHWDVWPGKPEEGVRNYEIDTSAPYEGDKALKVNLEIGNAQAVYQYCVQDTAGKFDFNQVYTFSCALRFEDVMTFDGKGVTIGIKRRGIDGNEYNVYQRIDEVTKDWDVYSVTTEAAPVEIIQYDVILDIGSGIGSVSMDDCRLELAEEMPEEPVLELVWE